MISVIFTSEFLAFCGVRMLDPSGFPCQTGTWKGARSTRTDNLIKDEKPEGSCTQREMRPSWRRR